MGSAPEAFLAPYAKRAKAVVGDRAKVFVAGRVLDLATAERVIADGAADMVAMVRAHLADPFLVTKTREGREREIVRCAGTNECMAAPAKGSVRSPVSSTRPQAASATGVDGTLRPATEPKRITVVGGGPAGMRAAGVAARRGHEVTLIERGPTLGGHLDLLRRLPTRGNWQMVIEDLATVLEMNGVEVRLGETATAASLSAGCIARRGRLRHRRDVGSHRILSRPPRPGDDAGRRQATTCWTSQPRPWPHSTTPTALGARVLILDDTGAYLPLGLAEVLGEGGAEVEILSRFPVIGELVAGTQDLPWLLPRLAKLDVRLSPNHFIESIDGHRVDVYETLTRRPRRRRRHRHGRALDDAQPAGRPVPAAAATPVTIPTHCIGDAVAPRSVAEAIYEGEKLGRAL